MRGVDNVMTYVMPSLKNKSAIGNVLVESSIVTLLLNIPCVSKVLAENKPKNKLCKKLVSVCLLKRKQ